MEFYLLLDNYIKEIGCTAKQLAEKSKLSASVISRYRSGDRVPSPDSDILKKLATGISQLSDQSYDIILGQMNSCLTSRTSFAKHAFYKIDRLVSELYIKQADIARALITMLHSSPAFCRASVSHRILTDFLETLRDMLPQIVVLRNVSRFLLEPYTSQVRSYSPNLKDSRPFSTG